MFTTTIMIIRHAEKPIDGESAGVNADGSADENSLTPRGWQRAGAWADFFVPPDGRVLPVPVPTVIFASAPSSGKGVGGAGVGSKSRRPLQTISPLAERLGIKPDLRFVKGEEVAVADSASKVGGIVLICWQHENIATIAAALEPAPSGVPASWPNGRFDMIYRFDREAASSLWSYNQLAPVLLDGDPGTNT